MGSDRTTTGGCRAIPLEKISLCAVMSKSHSWFPRPLPSAGRDKLNSFDPVQGLTLKERIRAASLGTWLLLFLKGADKGSKKKEAEESLGCCLGLGSCGCQGICWEVAMEWGGGSLPTAHPFHSSPFFDTNIQRLFFSQCKSTQLSMYQEKLRLQAMYIKLWEMLCVRRLFSCFHCKMRQPQLGNKTCEQE